MTVYRRLKSLSYLASYSQRGKFYTLPNIPDFNDMGIWSHQRVYFSGEAGVKRAQLLLQRQWRKLVELGAAGSALPVDEVKAAMILFFSLLDEKQRRLYAGLESVRLGYGGRQADR